MVDWNNFDGHITAGGFVYAKKEKKFLVMYHKDLKMFLYPGGHMDKEDSNPLEAAKREVFEETGLSNPKVNYVCDNELVPLDIDIHVAKYNERLNLPSHYHFDFRYLFSLEEITDVSLDLEEHSTYKWISEEELSNEPHYGAIIKKIDWLKDKK